MSTASHILGARSACMAVIVACTLGLTYCGGDSTPAGQCTPGEGVCDGDVAKQCTAGGQWEVKQDCSEVGRTCKVVGGGAAACVGGGITLDSGTTVTLDSGTPVTPDSGTTVRPDSGTTVRPEGGIIILPDGSTVTPDSGIVTFPDSATVVPDSGTTGLSCLDIIGCLNACASGDQTCANACIASGTPTAQQQLQAVAQCVQTAFAGACATACSDPASAACNTCLETECTAEMNACVGGTTTPGTQSCDQVWQCISNCGGDATCETNCVNQGTPTAQQQLQAVAQCINTAASGTCASACTDPASAACNTCLETECTTEIGACFGGTPTGLTCVEVLQCLNACASGDQTCANNCLASGTPAAQQQVQSIATCVQTAVAGTCATPCVDPASVACDTCLETECTAELTACTGGGSTPATMTCDQVVQCISGCGSDQTCANNCVSQGTPAAQQELQAMVQCINTAATGTCDTACADPASAACDTCLETECSAEIATCLGTP